MKHVIINIHYHAGRMKIPHKLSLRIEGERMPDFCLSDGQLLVFATKFNVEEHHDKTDEDYDDYFAIQSDQNMICVALAGHTSRYSYSYQGGNTHRIDLSEN